MNELTAKKGMPWTGFEDANGTRIYEDDLFLTEDGATLRVVLDGESYCLEPYDGIADCQSMDWATNHVIAGSLHDEN